ncbi:OmpA family protein [Sulfuriferula sp. GW1]|uniref:OmpA family protein n=1 Tax=Sulfuriferula sp. GW1 TaxID=3345111 RepID=UPI0039B09ED1
MRFSRSVVALVITFFVAGCTAGTTFILMPDETGMVGAITIKTSSDFRVINQAYNPVRITEGSTKITSTHALTEAQVKEEFAHLINAQPSPPASFVIHFATESSALSEKSRLALPRIIASIKARAPAEVTIIGHTDTTGTDNLNNRLAYKRAKAVEDAIKDSLPPGLTLSIEAYGSKTLLIPTPTNVDEQRNRAVEILIL